MQDHGNIQFDAFCVERIISPVVRIELLPELSDVQTAETKFLYCVLKIAYRVHPTMRISTRKSNKTLRIRCAKFGKSFRCHSRPYSRAIIFGRKECVRNTLCIHPFQQLFCVGRLVIPLSARDSIVNLVVQCLVRAVRCPLAF